MIYRHINRGDIKEGGCPLCKPRVSRRGDWTKAYFDGHPADEYLYEETAEGSNDHDHQEKGEDHE